MPKSKSKRKNGRSKGSLWRKKVGASKTGRKESEYCRSPNPV